MGRRGAIPVTRPARTVLDLATVEPALVEGALDDALVRGLTTLTSVIACSAAPAATAGADVPSSGTWWRNGGRGAGPPKSRLEDRIVSVLRRHGLPEPVRQHRVTLPDGRVVRIDLAYPDVRVGIEADGRVWHSGRSDCARDRSRANRLAAIGWTLLRYGWADLERQQELVAEVAAVHEQRAS